MTRGRKKKPSALNELHGNPGKRPRNENEPKPPPVAPPCPSHLGYYGKKEWRRIAPLLEKLGLLTELDQAALAGYCSLWETYVRAERQLNKSPDKLVGLAPSGYPIQNPYIGIRNTALREIRNFCSEFGLTPSSRGRMQVPGAEEEDEFELFLEEVDRKNRAHLKVVGDGEDRE